MAECGKLSQISRWLSRMTRFTALTSLLAVLLAAPAAADVVLEIRDPDNKIVSLFSNGMVLQREMTVPIFGRADVGEEVTVSFMGQEKVATTEDYQGLIAQALYEAIVRFRAQVEARPE